MRIGCVSYPIFREHHGGLEIQLNETVAHLKMAGVNALRIDPSRECLSDFDLLHVFSTENEKVIRSAKLEGKPVILSSVLAPNWSEWENLAAKFCTELTAKLTRWKVKTSFQQLRSSLDAADHIIALGSLEQRTLIDRYNQPANKITIIPNGVSQRFFDSTPEQFLSNHKISSPFVFCAAEISDFKNQLAIVRATAAAGLPVVLAGSCPKRHQPYLQRCISEGDGRVHYLGHLDHSDPLLASVYAAADAFVLPSRHEVMPLSVLEALASGTPVILTQNHSIDIAPCPPVFGEVDSSNEQAIAQCIESVLRSQVDLARCKALVESYRWENIVAPIIDLYKRSMR